MISEKQIFKALSTVIDPELNVNIVDLGLVYGIEILKPSGGTNTTRTVPANAKATAGRQDDSDDLDSLSSESSEGVRVEMTLVFVRVWWCVCRRGTVHRAACMFGDGNIRSGNRCHGGAIDRVPLGDKTPFRSAGRCAPVFKEPDALSS